MDGQTIQVIINCSSSLKKFFGCILVSDDVLRINDINSNKRYKTNGMYAMKWNEAIGLKKYFSINKTFIRSLCFSYLKRMGTHKMEESTSNPYILTLTEILIFLMHMVGNKNLNLRNLKYC